MGYNHARANMRNALVGMTRAEVVATRDYWDNERSPGGTDNADYCREWLAECDRDGEWD